MKAQIIVFVVALFCANAHAQLCYNCISITTDNEGLVLPTNLTGFDSCTSLDKLTPLNCSEFTLQGQGCVKGNITLNYNISGTGAVNVDTLFRTCSEHAPADTCNDKVVLDWKNSLRDVVDSLLPTNGTNNFISATGKGCSCTSNLCNGGLVTSMAPVWKISSVSFLMSLLISYIAI